jgi:ABC-type dipeptide/oligopeptide/nickel transport system ATPase component
MLRLVMTQVCADRSRPVDVRVTRSPRSLRAVQRASQSLTRVVFEPAQEVIHDFPDYLSCGFKRFAGNRSA